MGKLVYGWDGRTSKATLDHEKMKEKLCMQSGTIILLLNLDLLYDNSLKYLDFFKNSAGGHIYLLRKEDRYLRFYYMSLGSKETRMAEVLISKINRKDSGACILSWEGGNNELKIPTEKSFITSVGEPSSIYLKIHNGEIVPIRGEKKQYVRIYHSNEASEPSAINIWNEILDGIRNLKYDYKEKRYAIFSINQSINSVITGFESYLKERFLELEKEGIEINKKYLIEKYKECGLKSLIEKQILNFQNYDNAKEIYKKVYNIHFHKLVCSQDIEKLKGIIKYRHQLTHVTPFLPVLNRKDYLKGKEAVEPTKELLMEIIDTFSKFIEKVHLKTLYLEKSDVEFKEIEKQNEISKKIHEAVEVKNEKNRKKKLEKFLSEIDHFNDKNKGHLYFNLGWLESQNLEKKKAINYYKKMIALKIPDNQKRNGCFSLIGLLIDEKDFKEAIKYIEKVKEMRGRSETVLIYEIRVYMGLDKIDLAIKKCNEILKIEPYSKVGNINLGNIYNGKNEFQLALNYFNKVEELEKEEAEIYSERGFSYFMLKNFEMALEDFKRAIELEPISRNYTHKGLAEAHKGDFNSAIKSYNKAIELDQKSAYAYVNKACVLFSENKLKEARINVKKAFELSPEDPRIIHNYKVMCNEE